ncbi:MAG: isoleucine--tRNA ligase [Nanoarchaeota archaeon]|nr:isoleucine--tRNA ligase [Nanoarchaeota archaeon]
MYNSKEIEPRILEFWRTKKIYEKVREKSKKSKKKPIYFLDGPPYTTGEIHVGTAWNKSLKDFYLRTKRMKGFYVWDRVGWDMHGLPITHKVLEKLKIEKKEIEKYGVEKFVKECEKFAIENMNTMTKQFKKMGVWMDWDNPYMTLSNDFIEGNWWLVKKAHENGYLYEGKKTMHWCPKCATSLAKHELEYKEIKDESIFVKFAIDDKKNEYLLVWTTTPWTLPYNLAVMVNPELDYVKVEILDGKEKKEKWIIAKALAAAVIAGVVGRKFKIVEEFKGEKLKGLYYKQPFFDEIPFHKNLKDKNKNAYSVVLSSEYVNTSSGTGLVHCAPGCGPEDYEVGHRMKLPAYNTLDEQGNLEDVGKFSGWKARRDDKKFTQELEKKGILLAKTKVSHDYAHCWRCKSAVVFRTTNQWFFDVENKLKKKMIELNKKVKWQPDWAGEKWMNSWLENLRDNGITRQIYWGIPLPIWKCERCKNYEVIGSIAELEKKSGKKAPKDLHMPYIDEIKIKCKCNNLMKRIPDVLDVWVDAGSTSWTCLYYPQKTDLFKKYWPADIIMEGKDQIRGWFNLLLVASMVAFEKHPYKSVYMHGFINDALGRKMSKSLGNSISPEEVIQKYGVDATRLYIISGCPPGLDLNYEHREAEVKFRNLTVFYNISKYLIDYAKIIGRPTFKASNLGIEEKYILSRLNSTIKQVNELFEDLQFNKIPTLIEELFLDLSRSYIQFTRDKISSGTKKERETTLNTISEVYYKCLLMLAPSCPFITEEIYQQFKKEFPCNEFSGESIHLMQWPKANEKFIDKKLEEQAIIAKEVIESALAERESEKIGLRWPLQELKLDTQEKEVKEAVKKLENIVKKQINVKKISITKVTKGKEFRKGKIALNTIPTQELLKEGFSREIVRRIQALRKNSGLQKQDKINLLIVGKDMKVLDEKKIKELVNATKISESGKVLKFKDKFKIKEKEFEISFEKV